MQIALVMTRAGPRDTGFLKLLVTPGGGKKAGSVTPVEELSENAEEPMMRGSRSRIG